MTNTVHIDYEPKSYQQQVHDGLDTHRFSVVVCHRGFGKSIISSNHILKEGLKYKGRYGYIAPYLKQSKAIAWDYLKSFGRNVIISKNESDLTIRLLNGSTIQLFGADNADAIRGLHFDGLIMDEVAQISQQTWGEVIRPTLSARGGWAVFIGTPKGIGLFSELYRTALEDDTWFSILLTVNDTKAFTETELNFAKQTMSEAQYRQEMLCDFGASSDDSFIPLDAVVSATSRTYTETDLIGYETLIGADIGRGGDDSVFITRKGHLAHNLRVLQSSDLMQVTHELINYMHATGSDKVFIDNNGIGAGVYDRLRQLGYTNVVGVNSSVKAIDERTYANLRVEMWGRMRDWLRSVGSIPQNQRLKQDLVTPTYHYDQSSRYVLQKKRDMRAKGLPSTDYADALALTFAYPNKDLILTNDMPISQRMNKQTYSVLSHFRNRSVFRQNTLRASGGA